MKGMFALVGMQHRDSEEFVRDLPGSEPLHLVREHGNVHDDRAIQVWARGRHVGYIAKAQNEKIAKAMDAAAVHGSREWVAILRNKPGRWPMIEIL